MKIIGADQRLAEPRGVKILLVGPTGVGKTSLLRTTDPTRVLFVDGEAGDLAVQNLPIDTLRVDDWATARNLACRIGGPNPSFSPTSCYSQAHYQDVGGPLENLDRYDLIFVDSITAISRPLISLVGTATRGPLRTHRCQGFARHVRIACAGDVDVAG